MLAQYIAIFVLCISTIDAAWNENVLFFILFSDSINNESTH